MAGYPSTYPGGTSVDLYLGATDPAARPEFDPRLALDVSEVVVQEDGGLLPLYEWSQDQFKEMGRGARLVSGSLTFNRSLVGRAPIWGRALWAVLTHTRRLPGGRAEAVRDLLRLEFCYEHPQAEAPDPVVHQEVAFTARRLTLVEREVATFSNREIADVLRQTGPVRALAPRRERHVFADVLGAVDSDTLVCRLLPDGDEVVVRLAGPDAPETPKPDDPDARGNFLAEWRGPHNRDLTDDAMEAHLFAWAVHATNEVRRRLTPSAPALSADGASGLVKAKGGDHPDGVGLVEDGARVRLVDDPGVAPEDQYGRRIFQVHHDAFGEGGAQGPLGEWLVRNGMAKAYPSTTMREGSDGSWEPNFDRLRRIESEARDAGTGAWGSAPPPA